MTNNTDKRAHELSNYMEALIHHFVFNKDVANIPSCNPSLTKNEIRVIGAIGKKDFCIMSELADQVMLAVSTLTGIIDTMVEKKYVFRERSESDRRQVLVKLTEDGKKIHQMHKESQDRMSFGILNVLDDTEQESMLNLFSKIVERLQLKKS